MTATRLPMIAVLMGPIATATAATGFCAGRTAGAWILLSTLRYCRSISDPKRAVLGVFRPLRASCRSPE